MRILQLNPRCAIIVDNMTQFVIDELEDGSQSLEMRLRGPNPEYWTLYTCKSAERCEEFMRHLLHKIFVTSSQTVELEQVVRSFDLRHEKPFLKPN